MPKPVISGGEEDLANLVLRLAISQMIAERAGQSFSLLVLDEVFGSLDESRRHNVVELLRRLQDRFEQVILITHIESVREGLDRVIAVRYDEESGRIAVRQRGGSDDDESAATPCSHGESLADLGVAELMAPCARWRTEPSPTGRIPVEARRHRAAEPGVQRRLHRALSPRRDGGRARAVAESRHLALRDRGRRRGGDALARRAAARSSRSTWCTTPAWRAGWVRSPCAPTRRGPGWGSGSCAPASTGSEREGAQVIGLETMPRTHGQHRLLLGPGLRSGAAHAHAHARCRSTTATPLLLGRLRAAREGRALDRACRQLCDGLLPGYDFTREIELTDELSLGDTVLFVRDERRCAASRLCHTAPLVEGRVRDELRVLKMVLADESEFEPMARQLADQARRSGTRQLAVRVQGEFGGLYRRLIALGGRVRWTDLRMTVAGRREPPVAGNGVVLSNWEI